MQKDDPFGLFGDGDRTEVVVRRAVTVHVALRDHRIKRVHAELTIGGVQAAREAVCGGEPRPAARRAVGSFVMGYA